MKTKRLWSLALVCVMGVSLCSCKMDETIGPGSSADARLYPKVSDEEVRTFLEAMTPEERYVDSMERLASMDAMDLWHRTVTDMQVGGQAIGFMDATFDVNITGLTDGNLAFDGKMSVSADDAPQEMDLCYIDNILYMASGDEKFKSDIDATDAMALVQEYIPPLFDASMLCDFSITKQDSSRVWISYQLSEDSVDRMLEELFGISVLDGQDLAPKVENASGCTVIAISDGDALFSEATFEVHMEQDGMDVVYTVSIEASHTETMPGYTVKVPQNASQYQEEGLLQDVQEDSASDSNTLQIP